MAFEEALVFTLKWEGGWAKHPNDPGGETYRGIARAFEPGKSWAGWNFLDQRTFAHNKIFPELDELVAEFYRINYWNPVSGSDLPARVAVSVFDHAVHSGAPRASKALQRIVGATVDGRIGPETIDAAWGHCDRLGAKELISYRREWLDKLAKRNQSLSVFAKGWLRRADDLKNLVDGNITL